MRLMILFIWRVWFYILASIPIIFLFPFLAIAAFHPKGYNFYFWCARYIWSPFILFLSGHLCHLETQRWRQSDIYYYILSGSTPPSHTSLYYSVQSLSNKGKQSQLTTAN